MPELPEVETLRRALLPLVVNKTCTALKFYREDIRFPIPQGTLHNLFANQMVSKIQRNGKYLLLHVPQGAMLLHLGSSGHVSLQISMTPRKNIRTLFSGLAPKPVCTLSIRGVLGAYYGSRKTGHIPYWIKWDRTHFRRMPTRKH